MLPLYLVHERKVPLVEVMHPHIPVLTTTGISSSLRIHRDRIQWSKMSLHSAYFLFKNLVIEPRFEFPLP